jgi:hypothetical protein
MTGNSWEPRALGPYNMVGDPVLEGGLAIARQPGLDWSDPYARPARLRARAVGGQVRRGVPAARGAGPPCGYGRSGGRRRAAHAVMDAATRALLVKVIERLEHHERRLQTLEVLAGPVTYDTHAIRHRRRLAVLDLRKRGLSVGAIAKVLAISRAQVGQIVRGVEPPADGRALDGKLIGARARSNGRGNRAAA